MLGRLRIRIGHFTRSKDDPDFFRHSFCHSALQRQHIAQITLIALGPNVGLIAHLHQSARDAHATISMFRMPAPDDRFDVMLEEQSVTEIGEVRRGREVIDDRTIEALSANQALQEPPKLGGIKSADRERH